jgi:monomeric isocitrate dehydrogenase
MDYKELFKLIENFTAEDFKDVREAIQKVIDNNPKVSLQDAQKQIESFHKIKTNE